MTKHSSTAPRWDSLSSEIVQSLRSSSYWTEKTKEVGKYIERLICPECGEPEAYASRESPFRIHCNRQNNCGAVAKTMPLLGISANVESRFKLDNKDRHRPAREFLRMHGLPLMLCSKKTNSSTAVQPAKAAAVGCSSQWARCGAAGFKAKEKRTPPAR